MQRETVYLHSIRMHPAPNGTTSHLDFFFSSSHFFSLLSHLGLHGDMKSHSAPSSIKWEMHMNK